MDEEAARTQDDALDACGDQVPVLKASVIRVCRPSASTMTASISGAETRAMLPASLLRPCARTDET